jgi:hypothetical protein
VQEDVDECTELFKRRTTGVFYYKHTLFHKFILLKRCYSSSDNRSGMSVS